jgi:hypothetical protein
MGDVAQPLAQPREPGDVVEAALASALDRASAAGEWSIVATLAREFEARRGARAGASTGNVIDLSKRRRGR